MNFPEKAIVSGPRTFVSEAEIEEKRRKRQDEWEKTRRPEDPTEAPGEEYDPRTLYQRLQENKMKKEAELEEAHKLKNMIRGLDSEEVAFLEDMNRAKAQQEHNLLDEEEKAIAELREAAALTHDSDQERRTGGIPSAWKDLRIEKNRTATAVTSSNRGQEKADLLKNCVKRKCPDDEDALPDAKSTAMSASGRMRCIGVLPGIGAYDHSDSSDSENSDSDSDLEIRGCGFALIPKVKRSTGDCG